MTTSNQIFLVMDAGSPKAAFTTRREMQVYLKRRRDVFTNPLAVPRHAPSQSNTVRRAKRCRSMSPARTGKIRGTSDDYLQSNLSRHGCGQP
jgi:hypothetical protein